MTDDDPLLESSSFPSAVPDIGFFYRKRQAARFRELLWLAHEGGWSACVCIGTLMGTFYNLWATNEELMETLSDKKRLSLKEQNKINLCYSTTLSNHNKTAPLNPVAFFRFPNLHLPDSFVFCPPACDPEINHWTPCWRICVCVCTKPGTGSQKQLYTLCHLK